MLQVAAGRRDELMLYGDDYPTPDGTCVRDYIHVADLATAHLLALDAIKPGTHEIYNLGNGDGYSNKQVIEAVREVTGRPVPVKLVAAPPRRHRRQRRRQREGPPRAGLATRRPDLHDIIADAWAFHQSAW